MRRVERVKAPFDVRAALQGALQNVLLGDESPRSMDHNNRKDEGLFGPGSVTWLVHQDAAMLVGGIRALFLQTMHPRAMAGVAQHSAYKDDPFGRLRRTSRYVGAVSFAPEAEAKAAIAGVRRAHRLVKGTTSTGETYAANDPHLLAWVHHALIDSFLVAYQQYGKRRLTPAEADRYVCEQSVLAEMIGAEPDGPKSVSELNAWFANIRPELQGTREARDAAFWLLTAPMGPKLAVPYAVLVGAAVGSLPRFVRRALWIPSSAVLQNGFIQPAAKAVTGTLRWAMTAPVEPQAK